MAKCQRVPRFEQFGASSRQASKALSGSKSSDTGCERLLRSKLWRLGLRFRKNVADLPGKPDVVFPRQRIVVFCDGDFWHGRDWAKRRRKLERGSNAEYWVAKIGSNRARDRRHSRELQKQGWTVLRLWESDILSDALRLAREVEKLVRAQSSKR